MTKPTLWIAGSLTAIGLLLAALPVPSQTRQNRVETAQTEFERRLQEMEESLQARLEGAQEEITRRASRIAHEMAARSMENALANAGEGLLGDDDEKQIQLITNMDEGGSWLGVEIQDVDAAKAKELKLPAERGVLLSVIVPDSPAAKAGLKEKDVITELNGQRIEGVMQFRRMIREIPAGRTVQLSVWRDGKSQSISATLGQSEERRRTGPRGFHSREFNFRIPEMPDMPGFGWHGDMFPGSRPRLGIDGEDLSGQLGEYFGAPEGEGILVRSVNEGSAAEKAGIKTGDVLIKFNGEPIRTVSDLREKLAGLGEIKEKKTVKIGLLRNRSEMTMEASIEPPPAPKARTISRRTTI